MFQGVRKQELSHALGWFHFAMLMRGYPTSVAYWPTGENRPDIEY